ARVDAIRGDQGVSDNFPAVLAFVERARTLQQGVDPVSGLAQVREAAANGVRILRVRVEQPVAPGTPVRAAANLPDIREPTLRVDGVVDPGRGMPVMQIAGFVERLRRAGYDPVPLDPQGGAGASRSAGGFFSYLLKRVPAPAPGTASGATP